MNTRLTSASVTETMGTCSGKGSDSFLRNARSTANQRRHAQPLIAAASISSEAAIVLRSRGERRSAVNVSIATPHAISASAVRTQARNVRSFASV
ncbi:hypothetical protein SAMN05660971_01525 [Halomonas cupida]|uniref:Uncharacterized protein n=1 Tax=Halomonas cupida TaxID=44933 RepID=A0A1M7DXJ5_9GAMM|nr:hypothetical protein SAMN05660971_01525 [Halomonas cupida]